MTAIASALVIMFGLFWYIWLVRLGKIQTVVASWIVSTTALVLSLVTYFTSPNANWLGGTLNAASAFSVALTLVAVYIRSLFDHKKVEFNPFQKKCLITSLCITILWVVIKWGMHGTGVIPNILTQLLLVISYSMLIVKSWKADKNTEFLLTWWCVFLSSVIGLYTAWVKADKLAFIYALRSTIMCGILIFALHRIDWKASSVNRGHSTISLR
jgi:hypothetical protein